MSKLKTPIIVVIALVAAGAGLFASGMIGGKAEGPSKKHVIEPITLAEPFVINLADPGGSRLLLVNVALKLEPMDEEHWLAFSGAGGGGHGGATEAPGPPKVAAYPEFRDAVIAVASTFTADDLQSGEGKDQFKQDLLARFSEIAEIDEADYKSSAAADDPHHLGPPYHVQDVDFTSFTVQ